MNLSLKHSAQISNFQKLILLPAYLIFTIWFTWPSIRNPRNTLVGSVGEDSTAQAAYRDLARILGLSVFDREKTTIIGFPEGGFIDQRQSFYAPLSSLLRDLASLAFSGVEINLGLSYISIIVSCHLGFLISRRLTHSFSLALLGSFIISIVPYRLHWISAANDLDATPFILLMIWYSFFAKKNKSLIRISVFLISLISTIWHPWTGILLLILALSQLTVDLIAKRGNFSIPLYSIIGFLAGIVTIRMIIFTAQPPSIAWTEGHSPQASNLFMFSWINPESRSFINPTLYIGIIVYLSLEIKRRLMKFRTEREEILKGRKKKAGNSSLHDDDTMYFLHILFLAMIWTLVLLGPFSIFGLPTPASLINGIVPQLRNGSYGMFLIQTIVTLLNIGIWGIARAHRKLLPYFPTGFVAGITVFTLAFALHLPVRKSVDEDRLLLPATASATNHPSRWMTEVFSGLNLHKARSEISSLKPGPILIFPYGTFYGDDPVNCLFLTDEDHPLVNSCNFLSTNSLRSSIREIKESENLCNQVAIARKLGVRYFIFLGYQRSPEQKICVESQFQSLNLAFKSRFIGDSQEVMLIEVL